MIDLNGDGKIVFSEFLQLFVAQKTQMSKEYEEAELWEVFVSLGGNADRTGFIQKTQLEEIVRKFGLAIDLEKWFDEVGMFQVGAPSIDPCAGAWRDTLHRNLPLADDSQLTTDRHQTKPAGSCPASFFFSSFDTTVDLDKNGKIDYSELSLMLLKNN